MLLLRLRPMLCTARVARPLLSLTFSADSSLATKASTRCELRRLSSPNMLPLLASAAAASLPLLHAQ